MAYMFVKHSADYYNGLLQNKVASDLLFDNEMSITIRKVLRAL